MKKFFIKQSRPSGREKQLSQEITDLIRNAELADDSATIKTFENFGVVKDEQGLEKLLQAIKSGTNGTPKEEKPITNQQNHTDMNNDNEKITDEQEQHIDEFGQEQVVFEPVINVNEQSQFAQPVVERNPVGNDFVSDNPNPEPELGDNLGEDGEKIEDGGFEPPQDDVGDTGGGGGNIKDLPPETKRKAINSSAKVLATIYQGAMPMLPKMIAKVSERKLKKMEWNNEINLQMRVPVDTMQGRRMMTIQQYIHDYNASIDETIQINDQMKDEFQECLKDVLQEKQVAMTPSARLAGIVALQAVALFSKSVELKMMMKDQMEMFKTWHEESKQNGGGGKGGGFKGNNPTEPVKPNPTKPVEPVTPVAEEKTPDPEVEDEMISISPEDVEVKK